MNPTHADQGHVRQHDPVSQRDLGDAHLLTLIHDLHCPFAPTDQGSPGHSWTVVASQPGCGHWVLPCSRRATSDRLTSVVGRSFAAPIRSPSIARASRRTAWI